MALTKAEMAAHLFEELGLSQREAKDLIEGFFEEIRASLERGEEIKLSGFGNFDLREKKERPGRNPKTGEEVKIRARRVVSFRPGQTLKTRVEVDAGPAQPSADAAGHAQAIGTAVPKSDRNGRNKRFHLSVASPQDWNRRQADQVLRADAP